MRIFLDSDVIISSVISQKGAAFLLIDLGQIEKFLSDFSVAELEIVVKRLSLSNEKLKSNLKNLSVINLKQTNSQINSKFGAYTSDPNDAHIVAGAVLAKCNFLITYNIRHYRIDKIKGDFNLIILTPAKFLQYLRSI